MHRVIEIADRPVHLSTSRGFIVVREDGAEIARIPIDDVGCLLLTGQQASLSAALLHALMERVIPVVVVGKDYHPSGLMLPITGHFASQKRLSWQIDATEPFKKRLWQQIIQNKIAHQATLCATITGSDAGLSSMVARVGSGDPQNIEAQAARRYWPHLFGAAFKRRADDPINAALNYGYAILRACVARHLVACGLNPALGIHHDNQENPFCLADDVIEPFRPFVDALVLDLRKNAFETLTPEIKKELATILTIDTIVEDKTSILSNAILTNCQSLARSFENKESKLIFPRFTK